MTPEQITQARAILSKAGSEWTDTESRFIQKLIKEHRAALKLMREEVYQKPALTSPPIPADAGSPLPTPEPTQPPTEDGLPSAEMQTAVADDEINQFK